MSAGTGLSKISFGNNIPGWATAVSKSPAVIILQVRTAVKTSADWLCMLSTGWFRTDHRKQPVSANGRAGSFQEWWGVTDEIKRQAQYLHEQKGYRVLIPDLYKGKLGVDAEEAGHVSCAWL